MAFNSRNFSSGEAAFVSTFTYHSEEDALEDILAPEYLADTKIAFELRDRIDLCDRDFRSCLARVVGFTLKGSPILRPYEQSAALPALPALPTLPETQPAEAGTARRRAA